MANETLIVTFNKPYTFEGKEYKEVDLSGIEDLTGNDLLEVDKISSAANAVALVPEMTLSYNAAIAARVSKQPIEFFYQLPAKDALKVKNAVMTFLNS